MEIVRSLLFVPGNRRDMLQKARAFPTDILVPDMEDSVPWAEKEAARGVVASVLPGLHQAGQRLAPRVNSLDTGLMAEDLTAVVGPHIMGISIGKIDSAWHISQVESTIEPLERRAGLPPGHVKIIPWIESAKGILNAYSICVASPRILGVALGAEDFTYDMGITRTESNQEVSYARSVVGVAARAAGVLAFDTPYFNFRDLEGLKADVEVARQYGFKGKFAIHPGQLELINTMFAPSPEEVEYARRVLEVWEVAEREGKGATSLDGRLIDVPVVKRARGVLAWAEAIAQRESLKGEEGA